MLFVPGFVADTYSEIEASFIDLCSKHDDQIRFLWLVASGKSKYDRYWDPNNRIRLSEPAYVTHLRKAGIPYVVADLSKYNVLSNFLFFRALFRSHPIDAVYTHFGFERFWATFFGKLFGKITIWNEHWHSLGTTHVPFKKFFYRLFVDYFVSISRFITDTLPVHARVITIPNSIRSGSRSDEPVAMRRQRLRQELGLDPAATVILMVAAFTAQKRHALALEICEAVLTHRKRVLFAFLGEGPEREGIMQRVRAGGLEQHFVFPGHVSNVDAYYGAADLCMFTGYNDGFGYTVLEAMTHSLPVVAFASGGPAEIIRDGESGSLIRETEVQDFVSNMISLVDDSDRRHRMGQKARQIVDQEFSRDVWINRIMTALRTMVSAGTVDATRGITDP